MAADKNKLEGILFDLDNTLILFDETEFFDHYFRIISQSFSDIMPHELFLNKLMDATRVLLENDGRTLNVHCFMNFFAQGFDGRDIDGSSLVLSQQFNKAATDVTPAPDHQGLLAEVAAVVNNNL